MRPSRRVYFYRQTFTVTPNTNFQFSGHFLNLPNPHSNGWRNCPTPPGVPGDPNQPGGDQAPNVSFEVDRTGIDPAPVEIFNTGNMPFASSPNKLQYGGIFNSGAATQIEFANRINAPGGVGNYFAIDDILVAPCNGLNTGSITGLLYQDIGGNKVYDTGTDTLLPSGVKINLINASGQIVSSQLTDANGAYSFLGILAACGYTLSVDATTVPAGYSLSANPTGANTTGTQCGVTVTTCATTTNQKFGFLAPITVVAEDDDFSADPIAGTAGGDLATSVLGNDTLNGNLVATDGSETTISVTADGGLTGVTISDDGVITVPSSTPADTYTVAYHLCAEIDPSVCDSADVQITVTAAPMMAMPDSVTGIDGQTGQDDVVAVGDNDTLDGVTLVDLTPVVISVVTPATPINARPVPLIDTADGTVDVPAGTPEGIYEITYQICEVLNPANCATAIVTVETLAVPPVAQDDELSGLMVGSVVTLDPLVDTGNGADADVDGTLDPTTVALTDPAAFDSGTDGVADMLSVAGQGTWTVDPATGEITFTREIGYTSDPTPVSYSVADNNGNPSNEAQITLDYAQLPQLYLLKSSVTVVDTNGDQVRGNAGDVITYRLEVTNTGNTRLAPVTVDDAAINVTGVTVAASLEPGSSASVDVAYTFTAGDVTLGYKENSATAAATAVDENGVAYLDDANVTLTATDRSDAGTDTLIATITDPFTTETPDGTGTTNGITDDDPTVTQVPLEASSLLLSGTVFLDVNGNDIFEAGLDEILPGYQVQLINADGQIIQEATSDVDGTYSMGGFPTGTYSVRFLEPDDGDPTTEPRVFKETTNLTFVADQAETTVDGPIDPSGVIYNAVTGAPIAGVDIRMTDASGAPLPAVCLLGGQQPQVTMADGRYRFDVLAGAYPACPAVETEYLLEITSVPAAYINAVSTIYPPEAGSLDATTCPIDAIPGGACQPSASVTPPPAGTTVPYYLSLLLAAGDPNVIDNQIPLDPVGAVPAAGEVSILKTVAVDTVRIGEAVPYMIEVTNNTASGVGPLVVTDRLPAGLLYLPGSAQIDGVAAAPAQSGQVLTFEPLVIAPGATLQITLTARVASNAATGDLINRADVFDRATLTAIAPTATATARLVPAHVFACSDVIGQVFDDLDRDGY